MAIVTTSVSATTPASAILSIIAFLPHGGREKAHERPSAHSHRGEPPRPPRTSVAPGGRGTALDVDDRARRPFATARRGQPAIIEGFRDGVGALASEFGLGQDLAELFRASVGLLALRLNALLPRFGGEWFGTVRIAKLHAARFGRGQCCLGALRDLGAFLFGDGRVNVQHERVGVRDLGDDERDALRHQAADERYIAAEPVELGGDHRAFVGRRAVQRGLELRPPFQCIGALRGLDFGIGLDDLVAFSGAEALNCGQLAFKAETGLPLLLGANADVGDNWLLMST